MNLLIIVSTLGIGGNERSALNIYHCLKEYYGTTLATFEKRDFNNNDANIVDLGVPATNSTFKRVINAIIRIKRIKKIVKKENIEVIYCLTNENNPVSLYRFKKIKKIVSCRDCGNLVRHTKAFYRMRKKSDFLIFNSEYMRNYYLSKYPMEEDVVETICNIVDTETIERKSIEHIEEDAFFNNHYVIIAVGRFCKEKGYNHLIRIFEEARLRKQDLGLVIIGDGELFNSVEHMVKISEFSDDIILLGEQRNPYKYVSKAQLFVMTSITEGFPNVILEAMTLGIPVVSTNCISGPSEVLDSREYYYSDNKRIIFAEYGVLAPALKESYMYSDYHLDDRDRLFAKAILCLCNNKELYNKYSSVSKKRAREFNGEMFAEKFSDVLKAL